MKTTLEILKENNITNFAVDDNGKITINGGLDLRSLTEVDEDFLKGTTINGWLDLRSLTEVHKDFLKETTINGWLDLNSLKEVDKDFLKGTTINGGLDLYSLKEADKDFLKGTTINGNLYLYSLKEVDKDFLKETTINGYLYLPSLKEVDEDFLKGTTINGSLFLPSLKEVDKEILRNNVKQLEVGYNEEKGYCFFDNILSKVISVKQTKGYVVFTTPFEFVAEKDGKTAHAVSIKKAIQDVEFKVVVEKLKKEKIKEDTIITVEHYRYLTGACENGIKHWKNVNNIEVNEITAKELLPILEKTNAYGLEKFKELVGF